MRAVNGAIAGAGSGMRQLGAGALRGVGAALGKLRPGRRSRVSGAHESVPDTRRDAPAAPVVDPDAPRGLDVLLLAVVLALLGLGTVMVFSSSAVFAAKKYKDGAFFLMRHSSYAGVGLLALYIGWRLDYRLYERFVYPLLLGTVVMLVALFVVGTRVDGAVRWFRFAGLSFQPSEAAKLTLVIYLAYSLSKKRDDMRLFSIGFLPHLCVAALVGALVLKQPDLGSTAILFAVTFLMLFVAGTRVSYILLALLAAAPIAYQQIVGTPWRLRRLIAFLDPWAYRQDAGYQISESLISVGSGGVHGLGLGAGKQKLFFLPAAHTDFIFAITGEELGLIGLMIVVGLFVVVIWRGVRAAVGARDLFGTYLAYGITATFALQALLHMSVVLGLVPTKGITLPFFSYGGSGLVMNLFSLGVLLNISARNLAPQAVAAANRRGTRKTDNRKKVRRVVVAEGES
jgi:cell division protein FtsW